MPLVDHDIDFDSFVPQLLPVRRRKPVRVAWLKALFRGLRDIHDKFLAYSDEKLEAVKYNGQTFVLQQFLILKFGAGIYITTNVGSPDAMLIGDGADSGSGIGTGFDFDVGVGEDYVSPTTDFTVHVPIGIVFVASEMQAFIRRYKLFGTTFDIVTF